MIHKRRYCIIIMDTYKYTPQKTITKAAAISGICATVAAVFLLMSALIEKYRSLFLFAFVIFAIIVIQLITRYIFSSYIFILDDVNFIIIRIYAQKPSQVCNVNLRTAIEISDKKSLKKFEAEFGKIVLHRTFCQNLWSEEQYIYIFEFDNKISAVKFDADEKFIDEMKLRIEQARLRYGE